MQATVYRYDPDSGAGSVLTDDGVVMPFTAEALALSGLRHLRPGQRLSVELAQADDPGPRDPGPSDPGPSDPDQSDPGQSDPGQARRITGLTLGTIGSTHRSSTQRNSTDRSSTDRNPRQD